MSAGALTTAHDATGTPRNVEIAAARIATNAAARLRLNADRLEGKR